MKTNHFDMILGFKKEFPWKEPTWFREKILANKQIIIPKIHTIREDKHNRWESGTSIQMVYRGPKYSIEHHFNKGIPELEKCVSVQTIVIKWLNIHTKPLALLTVTVDGHNMNHDRLQILAKNNGFDSVESFLRWFSKDFTGKIIHWTDFK